MTRHQLFTQIRQQFIAGNIPDAANEARDLTLAGLNLQRVDLLNAPDAPVLPEQSLQTLNFMQRRLNGEPVDRILGYREFYGHKFYLNLDTLSPREDSECVVNLALSVVKDRQRPVHILDLGTGTGCLLLTLLAELPSATGLGIDLSQNAVNMAGKNAQNLKLDARARFITSDWFENVTQKFDLIISNPPYIETHILLQLEREVREHDPMLALDGGSDGLNCYRLIAARAGQVLNPNGYVVVEIGMGQSESVTDIFRYSGLAYKDNCIDGGGICRGLAFKSSH